ncbi:hypothetical protein J5N97_020922 [Dioscorea zingiberensis]|uniref:Peptidase metallopeptidase domain-containing protein n=1 Tax=Dioscorea zingiberensis TaxID=325984 RepID=A0A9D5HE72_9LILI|nr:hypothetical protein J5N97_020922 [Dioscorea zingiberensis]
MPRDEILAKIKRGCNLWSQVIPVNFIEAKNTNTAHIKIGFDAFEDSRMAYVHIPRYFPADMHINAERDWVKNPDFDLEETIAHEMGHVLGLKHSLDEGALMYSDNVPNRIKGLSPEDIKNAQAIYGVRVVPTTIGKRRNTKFSCIKNSLICYAPDTDIEFEDEKQQQLRYKI